MINIFPIILLIITFWGVKAYGRSTSPDFFTLQQTKNIQGIACIFVILHHLVQQVSGYGVINKGPITILNDTGIFFTAIFFFVSGYGLMISLETKPDYLDKFLLKRLPTVLIPFWIVNIIGVILNIFLYGPVNSPLENLFAVLGLNLIYQEKRRGACSYDISCSCGYFLQFTSGTRPWRKGSLVQGRVVV